MSLSFPVDFEAYLLGKSRVAGTFEAEDRTVEYPDAYDLGFESSDGLMQTVRVSLKDLDTACEPGLDISKTPQFTPLRVVGDVVGGGRGIRLKPTKVTVAKPISKSA